MGVGKTSRTKGVPVWILLLAVILLAVLLLAALPTAAQPARPGAELTGVYTYHNDLARDGANEREYALTPADINAGNFGKLFSCPVDGAIYTQPLWVPHLEIAGKSRNVVFVATAHDSLYAFDADASPCVQLWKVSLYRASWMSTGSSRAEREWPQNHRAAA